MNVLKKKFKRLMRTQIIIEKILEDPVAFSIIYQFYLMEGKSVYRAVSDLLDQLERVMKDLDETVSKLERDKNDREE